MKHLEKIPYLALVALLLAAAAAPAAASLAVPARPGHGGPGHGPGHGHGRWHFGNVTYDQLLTVFYNVRNESMPLLTWAIENNVTLAERIIARAELLHNKSLEYNQSGMELRAKMLILLAARVYAMSPITARIVLAKTIRGNLGENHTVTNETVLAVLEKAEELRNILMNAINYAVSHNVTLPPNTELLLGRAEFLLNMSRQLLSSGNYRAALHYAVHGYILYTVVYRIVLYSTIISGLLPSPWQPPMPHAAAATATAAHGKAFHRMMHPHK